MGNQSEKDFSRFDAMSTEELNMFLRGFLDTPESDNAGVDMDAVLYVMEVVTKRDKETNPDDFPNVEDAWRDFNEKYRPTDKELELARSGNSKKVIHFGAHNATPSQKSCSKWHRAFCTLSKVACTAAAVVMLFFCGIGVASAAGYDVWNKVASWTEDIFTFRDRGGNLKVSGPTSHESDGSGSYDSLQDALDAYGITAPIAPKWIPKGYNAESVTAITTESGVNISAIYISQEGQSKDNIPKGIEVNVVFDESNIVTWHIQKDEGDPEVYEENGVEHYIVTNTSDSIAVWHQGNCRCLISGNSIGLKDLKMILDSIYWRS